MGYKGFPAAICISPNDVVVHGIPGGHLVQEGDVITVDVGVTLAGFIADSAYTFPVGRVDAETQRLLDVGQEALGAGIAQAQLGNRVGDVSHAVQEAVEAAGFAVVRSLVGHGVGRHYHEDPHVPNFGLPGRGPAALRGDDDRDRADDHGRRVGRLPPHGRLDDHHHGRLDRRAFRAHRGDHRRRAARPDPSRRDSGRKGRFATVTSPLRGHLPLLRRQLCRPQNLRGP